MVPAAQDLKILAVSGTAFWLNEGGRETIPASFFCPQVPAISGKSEQEADAGRARKLVWVFGLPDGARKYFVKSQKVCYEEMEVVFWNK